MQQPSRAFVPARPCRSNATLGFTLIEVMITVAIIGILAAIALPSYRDYIVRGQVVDATNLLSGGRANMERYFQDNRTYASVTSGSTTLTPPCASGQVQGYFTLSCTGTGTPTGTTYKMTATGSGPVAAFTYTVDQQDTKSTTIAPGGPWPAGTSACYIMKRGQTC